MTNPSSPIHRQWRLIHALSARRLGLTVREMAAEAEADIKTIRKFLELLREG